MTKTERLSARIIPKAIVAHRAKARAAGVRLIIADTEVAGLRLTIGANVETWSVRVRPRGVDLDGKRHPTKDVTIGDARAMTPEEARNRAREVKGAVRDGADPTAERLDREQKERDAKIAAAKAATERAEQLALILGEGDQPRAGARRVLNFKVLADAKLNDCARAYVRHGATGRDRHRNETEMQLRLALSEMNAGDLRPADLSQSEVRQLVRHHEDRPATAIARHGALNRLFKWLVSESAAASNPVEPVDPPSPPPPRSDVMSAAMVKALWNGTEALAPARRDYLRLALLLPLRRQELADVRRSYITSNGSRLEITLPAHATKSGRAFSMPLQGEARAIVERLLAEGDHLQADAFLIPMTRDGSAMNSWKRFGEAVDKSCGVHFNLHATRRTFASELAEHGVGDFALVDELLNHAGAASKPGAARHYFHAQKSEPRAQVMGEWGRLVAHAIEHGEWPRAMENNGNVIPLRRTE